jgi:hypothetical protein
MAKKEEKKSVKPSEKKMVNNILLKHPEVLHSVRNLFRNENGRTIVEDRVPRGDPDRKGVGQPFCQADLTDPDLRNLAKYASGILDEHLLKYDEKTAHEDALHRAINELEGGKYAGKVNTNTFNLILSTMEKRKPNQPRKASDYSVYPENTSNEVKEDPMSRSEEIKSLEAKLAGLKNQETMERIADFIVKQTPEEREVLKAMIKAAADQNDPKRWQKTMDAIGMKGTKGKQAAEESKEDKEKEEKAVEKATGKPHDESEPGHEEKETKKEKEIEEKAVGEEEGLQKKDKAKGEEKDASAVVKELGEIAGELEATKDYDLFKVAYQLDQIADVLEGKKSAATLDSDQDEKYMREAFQWTVYKKEPDEKFMTSFATDKTQEIFKAYEKLPYGVVDTPQMQVPSLK